MNNMYVHFILSILFVHGQYVYPFLLKSKLYLLKQYDVFKFLKLSFYTFLLRSFPSKGDFFVQGRTFSKISPSIKESKKENEKNLKIGRKKSNCLKKPTADTFLTPFSRSETHFSHVLRFYPSTKSNYPKSAFPIRFLSLFHLNHISIFKQSPARFPSIQI